MFVQICEVITMTNNEMALELLELIGPDPRQNCILKGAIRQLLKEPGAALKQHEPRTEAVKATDKVVQEVRGSDTEEEPAGQKKRGAARKNIDMGKVRALLKAGWSIAKVADEFNVSDQTMRKRLKEEGLLK